jgi:hypothetical protein
MARVVGGQEVPLCYTDFSWPRELPGGVIGPSQSVNDGEQLGLTMHKHIGGM